MTIITDSGLDIRQSLTACGIRVSLHGGITDYLESGINPGSFLESVICNDLVGAVCRADDDMTRDELKALILWFYNEAPGPSNGSRALMERWMQSRRELKDIENA